MIFCEFFVLLLCPMLLSNGISFIASKFNPQRIFSGIDKIKHAQTTFLDKWVGKIGLLKWESNLYTDNTRDRTFSSAEHCSSCFCCKSEFNMCTLYFTLDKSWADDYLFLISRDYDWLLGLWCSFIRFNVTTYKQ